MARIFELPIAILPDDIDELGHVNNVTYVRWVQEAAVAHWRADAAPQDQAHLLWIVLRHEIDYKHPAMANDRVIARTWVGKASRLKFERRTDIIRAEGGTVLASAVTMWCPIDKTTRRPIEVSASVRATFSSQ